jgi:DNA primase large subunit
MMAEKESLMAQYQSIAEQMAVVDQAQKPLLQELNEVKKQVEEFDGQRQEAQVRAYPPCLFLPIHISLASRVELRRPLNSG